MVGRGQQIDAHELFELPMEMFNVPPVMTLAEGNFSQVHE